MRAKRDLISALFCQVNLRFGIWTLMESHPFDVPETNPIFDFDPIRSSIRNYD